MADTNSQESCENLKKKLKVESETYHEKSKSKSKRKSHLFENKVILAPMVRANSLPFRLLCLQQGVDLVYSEELIDHRLVTCKRIVNSALGTIDFVDKDGRVVFRTCAAEKDHIVLQIGSNCPERALNAAKLVGSDVMAIDFNFGCPKKFSISGGMGAALLEEPVKIKALLTTCVDNLNIPVTCKIRLLPDLSKTIDLVKMIESCGVSAIAVHGRTRDQRPRDENDINALKLICNSINIPLIANGESNNLKTYNDITIFRNKTGASSVMVARAAMKNPAIFKKFDTKDNILSNLGQESYLDSDSTNSQSDAHELNVKYDVKLCDNSETSIDVIKDYTKLAIRYENHISNTKYSLQTMVSNMRRPDKEFLAKFHRAKDMVAICDLLQIKMEFIQ